MTKEAARLVPQIASTSATNLGALLVRFVAAFFSNPDSWQGFEAIELSASLVRATPLAEPSARRAVPKRKT